MEIDDERSEERWRARRVDGDATIWRRCSVFEERVVGDGGW